MKVVSQLTFTQATYIQEEEIIISINLPYVEGTSEKLRRILRSQKIRSTFYTEMTDEHKISVRNCDCDKNEIAKHCWEADHNFNWDQKKAIDRESSLIPGKIKESIHSLKSPNHINKIS